MKTIVVAVAVLSACFMQQVSGYFLAKKETQDLQKEINSLEGLETAVDKLEENGDQLANEVMKLNKEAAKDGASGEVKKAAAQADNKLEEAAAQLGAMEATFLDRTDSVAEKLDYRSVGLNIEAEKPGASDEVKKAADEAYELIEDVDAHAEAMQAKVDEQDTETDGKDNEEDEDDAEEDDAEEDDAEEGEVVSVGEKGHMEDENSDEEEDDNEDDSEEGEAVEEGEKEDDDKDADAGRRAMRRATRRTKRTRRTGSNEKDNADAGKKDNEKDKKDMSQSLNKPAAKAEELTKKVVTKAGKELAESAADQPKKDNKEADAKKQALNLALDATDVARDNEI